MPKTIISKEIKENKETKVGSNNTSNLVSKFTLPKKKVTLRPIIRKHSFMGKEDHDGVFMFTGAYQVWSIFRDEYGNYIDPLTDTERVYLERALNEDLNINHENNYWKDFEVKITKDTYDLNYLKREFDLSNPKDYLAYKLLLTAPDVANSLAEKDNTPEYRWVLVEKDEPIQGKITKGRKKSFCYKWLEDNRTKPTNMKDVLYVLGIAVSRDATRDELESNIIDIIEGSKMDRLYDVLNDDNFHTEVLFNKALKSRAVIYNRGKYYDRSGNLIAVSKKQMLEWLASPENSVAVKAIEAEIKKAKL